MMPAYPFVFIDLDGTITDSIRGVLNAVEYALARIGRPYPRAELGFMMGPPLRDGFGRLLGDDTLAQRCVSLYREYYTDRGIFECTVYDGVPEMLKGLRAAGCRISLATSKPIPFAQRILDHFHLTGLFDIVDGADMTGPVQHKPDVLKRAMGRLGADPASSLMVRKRSSPGRNFSAKLPVTSCPAQQGLYPPGKPHERRSGVLSIGKNPRTEESRICLYRKSGGLKSCSRTVLHRLKPGRLFLNCSDGSGPGTAAFAGSVCWSSPISSGPFRSRARILWLRRPPAPGFSDRGLP